MNPYQNNIESLNRQIRELELMKTGYQNMPQPQPIQNIINTTQQINQFEAKFLKKDEKVEDFMVQHKTAFISPENGFLKIKDIDGSISEFQLIPPKDEKDLIIEELERKLKEYEQTNRTNVKRKSSEDGREHGEE